MLAGEWLVAVTAGIILGASILITGLLFGWDQYMYYFLVTVPALLSFSGREVYYNQGLGSFFARILSQTMASEVTFWASALLVIVGLSVILQ